MVSRRGALQPVSPITMPPRTTTLFSQWLREPLDQYANENNFAIIMITGITVCTTSMYKTITNRRVSISPQDPSRDATSNRRCCRTPLRENLPPLFIVILDTLLHTSAQAIKKRNEVHSYARDQCTKPPQWSPDAALLSPLTAEISPSAALLSLL